jgi:hypothetical protein
MKETHLDILMQKKIPRVGQTVRSKTHGTLWRVIEKKEVWQNTSDDPQTGKPRLIPAIQLTYWKVRKGVQQGIGQMLGYAYTLHDNTFEANWDVVEDEKGGGR